jgi:hypothetical protein
MSRSEQVIMFCRVECQVAIIQNKGETENLEGA